MNVTVLPEQYGVGPVIAVGAAGTVPGVTISVSFGPVPQALVALTMIVPLPVPIPALMDGLTLEPSIDQPDPSTVHE